MVALDFADSAVVALVPPASVEIRLSAGSLLWLALAVPVVGSNVEVSDFVMLSHNSFPEADPFSLVEVCQSFALSASVLCLYPGADILSIVAICLAAALVEKFGHF